MAVIPRRHTLLFDLDGTISDPFVGISTSINYALSARQFATVDVERIRPLVGPPLHDIFVELTSVDDAKELSALVDSYRERYASIGYTGKYTLSRNARACKHTSPGVVTGWVCARQNAATTPAQFSRCLSFAYNLNS